MSKQVTIKLGAKVRLVFEGGENEYLVTAADKSMFQPNDEFLVFNSIKFPVFNTPSRFEIIIPAQEIKDREKCTQPLKKISKAMHRRKMKSITQKQEKK